MVIVQFCGDLVRQYRASVIDSLGLEITCVTYITVLCVQGILILSPLLLMPSPYSTL